MDAFPSGSWRAMRPLPGFRIVWFVSVVAALCAATCHMLTGYLYYGGSLKRTALVGGGSDASLGITVPDFEHFERAASRADYYQRRYRFGIHGHPRCPPLPSTLGNPPFPPQPPSTLPRALRGGGKTHRPLSLSLPGPRSEGGARQPPAAAASSSQGRTLLRDSPLDRMPSIRSSLRDLR